MTIKLRCVVGLLATLLSVPALATLINSDFSSSVGWNDASLTGVTSIAGGEAQLSTGAGGSSPFSAVLVQGDDGSFSFSDPIILDIDIVLLTFSFRFQDDGVDAGESGVSAFADFLSVALYDEMDGSGLSDLFFNSGDHFTQSLSWLEVTLDVSALAGHTIALSFELNDEDDGVDSSVFLDNVMFSVRPVIDVPEPSQLVLYSLGLLGLVMAKRKTKTVLPCT